MVNDEGRYVLPGEYRYTCLTVDDVAAHADRLGDLLTTERRKVATGHYRGDQQANAELISALEGRIAELRTRIADAQAGQALAADAVALLAR